MYAIIRTGGKQYRVEAGDLVRVEKLESELGTELDSLEILFVGGSGKTFIGQPLVKNAKVTAVVTQQAKGPKVIVFKKKRRKGYRKLTGHRQFFTELFIKSITSPEGETVKAEKAAPIIDPAKKAERLAAFADKVKLSGEQKTATVKKVAKKKVTKKASSGKKKATKKTGKKVGAKKKSAKKVTKKTTKKS
jgi:large subunit ribosomal protein L21